MPPSPPPYVQHSAGDATLHFRWDDWQASEVFAYDSADLVARAQALAIRAQVALGIGMYEWIVWRFASLSDDPTPHHIAEAAWCSVVHRAHMKRTSFDRRESLGPVRGPLWCAMTWLVPLVLAGDNDPEERESGLAYLPRLAMHVLPEPDRFERWADRCLERLASLYPALPQDPLDDLFAKHEEERRGPLVSPEVLDPDRPYDPSHAPTSLGRILAAALAAGNPFVRTPDEVQKITSSGTPLEL